MANNLFRLLNTNWGKFIGSSSHGILINTPSKGNFDQMKSRGEIGMRFAVLEYSSAVAAE